MLILSFLVSVVVFLIKQIWPFIILGLAIGFWATGRFQPARGSVSLILGRARSLN